MRRGGEALVVLTVSAAKARAARHGRARALVLLVVHLVIAAHIAHWLLAGRTVAPLELNESMYTLERGVITVGGILMALIVLSVFVFGRFFCSWGCHVLALQDGAAWLLERVGIRPRPVRSRLAPLVGLSVAFYMFAWPQVERLWFKQPWAGLRVTTDEDGLGSLVTSDFLRNLPGPWVAGATFLVCGGVLVWLLGTRSFCRFACPYGAAFSIVDRVSIGGIRLTGDCDQCGLCTTVCTTHIRVHEEIAQHGRVVSPNCLKDLDCTKICPRNALSWGFGAPSLLRSIGNANRSPNAWMWREDVSLLGTTALGVLTFRSLYGELPLFLAVGIGLLLGWCAVMSMRMWTNENLRVARVQLRLHRRITRSGRVWWVLMVTVFVFVTHSAWIRWHEAQGQRAWQACSLEPGIGAVSESGASAVEHLELVLAYGLWQPPYAHRMLADVYAWMGQPANAIPHAQRMTELWPEATNRWQQLAALLRMTGDERGAERIEREHLGARSFDSD